MATLLDILAGKGSTAGKLKSGRLGSKNDPDLTGRSKTRRVAGRKRKNRSNVSRDGYETTRMDDV